ncbi:hypothetical protein [Frateuria defendens]|uniref:hypothetical protein n=1 Tax=Frateuria defendens TaxID=2219559 RepID=UPI000A474A9E|nr:hypothetical protein [Frateuria defendens]
METAKAPGVSAASVVALRLFDVAYAIDLDRARTLGAARMATVPRRPGAGRRVKPSVSFEVPPLMLALGTVELAVDGGSCRGNVSARLYDFGVAAISIAVPGDGLTWEDYVRLVDAVDQATSPEAATDMWRGLRRALLALVGPALRRPGTSALEEDYLLAIVDRFDEPMTSEALWRRLDLAPLLSGERRPLAVTAREDLLRQRFSFYADDTVVLTRERAFIHEPAGDSGAADILEVANAQLLELRYYNALLNDELPRMYDLVAQTRRTLYVLAPHRLANLARKLYALVAEVTELTEKVDNTLEVTEDAYLARIYTAALELMRVPAIGTAVDCKLAIIRDTYAALYDEASASRAGLLETTIVVLIVVEIVLVLAR